MNFNYTLSLILFYWSGIATGKVAIATGKYNLYFHSGLGMPMCPVLPWPTSYGKKNDLESEQIVLFPSSAPNS